MTSLVKPLLLSAAGFAVMGAAVVAQPPTPPAAPLPALAPLPAYLPYETLAVGDPGDGTTLFRTQAAPRTDVRPAVTGGGYGGSYPGAVQYRTLGDDPRTRDLARKLSEAKDDEAKDKLRGELKAALAKAFDERVAGQEKQVADLETQLKRLKGTVEKRKEAKSAIVADRLAALEKEARGLGW